MQNDSDFHEWLDVIKDKFDNGTISKEEMLQAYASVDGLKKIIRFKISDLKEQLENTSFSVASEILSYRLVKDYKFDPTKVEYPRRELFEASLWSPNFHRKNVLILYAIIIPSPSLWGKILWKLEKEDWYTYKKNEHFDCGFSLPLPDEFPYDDYEEFTKLEEFEMVSPTGIEPVSSP